MKLGYLVNRFLRYISFGKSLISQVCSDGVFYMEAFISHDEFSLLSQYDFHASGSAYYRSYSIKSLWFVKINQAYLLINL